MFKKLSLGMSVRYGVPFNHRALLRLQVSIPLPPLPTPFLDVAPPIVLSRRVLFRLAMYQQNPTKVKKAFKQDKKQRLDVQLENSVLCMRIQDVLNAHKTWKATKATNDNNGHNNDVSGNNDNAGNDDIGVDGPWWMDGWKPE